MKKYTAQRKEAGQKSTTSTVSHPIADFAVVHLLPATGIELQNTMRTKIVE